MNLDSFLWHASLAVLLYFVGVSTLYLCVFCVSFKGLISHQLRSRFATPNEILKARLTPPVSVLAPAFNEEKSIVQSVRSLLRLEYGQYEVIVINDGSRDGTLEALKREFSLRRTAREYQPQIPTQPVSAIFRSETFPNLVVVDKVNGGKADSLNAGINVSTYPLFCCIDADSLLERAALLRVVHPFMEAYSETVATGGLVRVANGCDFSGGQPIFLRASANPLVLFQIVEYFRAFLSGRMAFSMVNCLLIISGAFGLFKKQAVIDAGGYRHDVVGEDMELVVRLHHTLRKKNKPCRVHFVPDPVCWTEVPETLKILSRQRNRWQRGLCESLSYHLGMLLNPRYGAVGLLAMPYFLFIEAASPVIEVFGYAVFVVGLIRGAVQWDAFLAFFLLAAVFGMMLSLLALLMEEVAFGRYPKIKDLLRLMGAAVLENVGYRQFIALVRAKGLLDWMRGRKSWGVMERKGLKLIFALALLLSTNAFALGEIETAHDALRAGDNRRAIAVLQEHLSGQPGDADARCLLGRALLLTGDHPAAEAEFRRALSEHPDHPDALAGLARALAFQEKMPEAESILRDALVAHPTNAELGTLLGQVLAWQKKYGESEREYERVLSANPSDRDALLGLSRLRAYQGRPNESSLFVERALAAHPGDRELLAEKEKLTEQKREALAAFPARYRARAGWVNENYSFATAGNLANVSFEDRRFWGAPTRLELSTLRRFDRSDHQVVLERTQPLPRQGLYAGASAGLGVEHVLFPSVRGSVMLGFPLARRLGGEVSAHYRRYPNVKLFGGEFETTYYSHYATLSARYGAIANRFNGGADDVTHPSWRIKGQLWPEARFSPWLAYARAKEAFEAGRGGVGDFSSHHLGGGLAVRASAALRFDFDYTREKRFPNRQHISHIGASTTLFWDTAATK